MAVDLKFDFSDTKKISNALKAAGSKIDLILVRAANHTGDKARTQMRKVLVGQTGLKRKTISKAVKSKKAFGPGLYTIHSKGGNVRLQFFKPRETRKGVTAAPWNKRRVYPGTFMKGGQFPKRKALGMGVLRRAGKARLPLTAAERSGLFIPTEMVTGGSEAAFYATVQREMPGRIAHELYRVLG